MTAKSWKKEARSIAATKPRKLLFLCVQNSARSQLAEAVARHLAPKGVTVLSAGSEPASVKPHVIEVLKEVSISADGLVSKSVEELDTEGVEAVVTLCAEEICPVYLGRAARLHWGLPDPARVLSPEKRMDAFRAVRDELMKRLSILLDYTV